MSTSRSSPPRRHRTWPAPPPTWSDAGQPLASTTTFYIPETTTYTTTFDYDADGRFVDEVELDTDGSQRSRRTVSYDDAAGTRSARQVGTANDYDRVETFSGGHKVHQTESRSDGISWDIHFKWDGDRSTEYVYDSNNLTDTIHYQYGGCQD